MSDQNAVLLTKEGLQKLKDEFDNLKNVRRREVAKKIQEASEHGDLSENAEYDEAKNEQALLESRIIQLESMIKHAKIIDENAKGTGVVVGVTVTLKSTKEDKEVNYTIVGSVEADPLKGKISNESPVGKAILGKKKGDIVKVKTPSGIIEYTVVGIKH